MDRTRIATLVNDIAAVDSKRFEASIVADNGPRRQVGLSATTPMTR